MATSTRPGTLPSLSFNSRAMMQPQITSRSPSKSQEGMAVHEHPQSDYETMFIAKSMPKRPPYGSAAPRPNHKVASSLLLQQLLYYNTLYSLGWLIASFAHRNYQVSAYFIVVHSESLNSAFH